jgi:hypothetical protein
MDKRLQFYYDSFKSLLGDTCDEAQILEQANFMFNKEKTVKRGDNILHIDYYTGLLTDDDLKKLELDLEQIGLELSYYNKTGVMYNSLDELTSVVRQILSNNVTHDILIGLAGSAIWESLCKIWVFTYKRLKGKKITKMFAGGRNTIKDATMSIVLKLNEATSIEYNLRGDFENDQEAIETFKKILENAKQIPLSTVPKRPIVAEANFETKTVEIIDEQKFYLNKIIKQKEKEKLSKPKKNFKKKRK